MLDLVVHTHTVYSDLAKDSFCWEATNEFFPEIIGVGSTEARALADFIMQLPNSKVH